MKEFALFFSLTLLNLGNFAQSTPIRAATLLLIWFFIFRNFINNKRKSPPFKIPVLILALLLIISIAVLRNNNPTTTILFEVNKLLTFLSLIILFIQTINKYTYYKTGDLQELIIWVLYIPLLALVFCNLAGHFIGLSFIEERGEIGRALFLSQLGITINRVSFPFSPGYNGYSSIVGILFLFSLIGYGYYTNYKKLFIIGIILSLITLLLSDTRSAILYPVLITLLFKLVFKRMKRLKLLWIIPLITLFGSAILLLLLAYVATIPELSFLSRSSGDLETGNGRMLIWSFAALEFVNFKFVHLVGYGEFGHFKSGASVQWAHIFGTNWGKAELSTPHSVFYSILFDYGYIGLAIVIVLQYRVLGLVKKYWATNPSITSLVLSFLIYWNILGIAETFFGFYTHNLMYFFLIFILLIYLLDYIHVKQNF